MFAVLLFQSRIHLVSLYSVLYFVCMTQDGLETSIVFLTSWHLAVKNQILTHFIGTNLVGRQFLAILTTNDGIIWRYDDWKIEFDIFGRRISIIHTTSVDPLILESHAFCISKGIHESLRRFMPYNFNKILRKHVFLLRCYETQENGILMLFLSKSTGFYFGKSNTDWW